MRYQPPACEGAVVWCRKQLHFERGGSSGVAARPGDRWPAAGAAIGNAEIHDKIGGEHAD